MGPRTARRRRRERREARRFRGQRRGEAWDVHGDFAHMGRQVQLVLGRESEVFTPENAYLMATFWARLSPHAAMNDSAFALETSTNKGLSSILYSENRPNGAVFAV